MFSRPSLVFLGAQDKYWIILVFWDFGGEARDISWPSFQKKECVCLNGGLYRGVFCCRVTLGLGDWGACDPISNLCFGCYEVAVPPIRFVLGSNSS